VQTERDKEVVDWLARFGAAGAQHVGRRFAMTRTRAYARLGSLVAAGLLEPRRVLYQEPALYVATASGLRWCGLERMGVQRVGAAEFVHAREVATVAVELHLALPGWRVVSERELRDAELDRGEPVGSAVVGELPGARQALHRPDLLLVSRLGRRLAVEVELSVKSRHRLVRICRGWARARHLDGVYYLAAPAAARAVARALAEVRAQDRVTVLGLDQPRRLAQLESEEVAGGAGTVLAAD
jgi:hypothetical protein